MDDEPMPQTEDKDERDPPVASEVMSRAIILMYLFRKAAATPPADMLREWMGKWSEPDCEKFIADFKQQYSSDEKKIRDAGLWNSMDESEREFMQLGPLETTMQHQIDAAWSIEAIACLQWALGRLDRLPVWDQQVDPKSVWIRDGETIRALLQTVSLRPQKEIEAMRDIAEAWHWRCRTYMLLNSGQTPRVLDNGVTMDQVIEMYASHLVENGAFEAIAGNDFPVFGKAFHDLSEEEFLNVRSISQERHKALNWLCGYAPENRWAETPTHT